MDLGECIKIHDHALRADFEAASKKKDYFYDVDSMEHLQNFINECDRRTEQYKKRLADTQEELSAEATAKLNKVHEIAEQMGKKLAEAEQLGAEGHVEESLKAMEEFENIKKQKIHAEQDYRNAMPASSYQQQKLRVCEVCSAYLGIHDNDRRLADHFGGKLHLGFITIREKLDELKALFPTRDPKSVNERRQAARNERQTEIEREKDDRDRRPNRVRSRSRDRNRRRRSHSRSDRRSYRSRSPRDRKDRSSRDKRRSRDRR